MEYKDVHEGCTVTVTPPGGESFIEHEWTEEIVKQLELSFQSILETVRTKFMK